MSDEVTFQDALELNNKTKSTQTGVKVKLVGQDGNVFNLIAIAQREMRRAGFGDEAKEMANKIYTEAKSYHEALGIIMSYCDVR